VERWETGHTDGLALGVGAGTQPEEVTLEGTYGAWPGPLIGLQAGDWTIAGLCITPCALIVHSFVIG